MAKLFLVRHGESEAQVKDLLGGPKNTNLTYKGHLQAIEAGNKLADEQIKYFVVSEYKRAIDTITDIGNQINANQQASIFNPDDLIKNEKFNERTHGDLTAFPKNELIDLFGKKLVDSWFKDIYSKSPGGESLFELYNRVIPEFVITVLPLARKANTLLVTHNRTMQALFTFLHKESPENMEKYKIENCKIYDFTVS